MARSTRWPGGCWRSLPRRRLGGGFGEFEIVGGVDLLERRRWQIRQRHLIGQFQHVAVRQRLAYLFGGRRLVESVQKRVNVILAV